MAMVDRNSDSRGAMLPAVHVHSLGSLPATRGCFDGEAICVSLISLEELHQIRDVRTQGSRPL